ncbi:MAG: hypothetical protein EOO39_26250 [Cytophagaceae bacterium]|nr:MAG: hypothetical protein EOO39_26250 [Cytophagaceae bacterium]
MDREKTISPDEFDKIKHHIQDIRIAMLTTQASTGALRSRPMATHQLMIPCSIGFPKAKMILTLSCCVLLH